MISANDLMTKARSYAIADATNITSGAACRVMSIAISASTDACDLSVYNATTAAGADLVYIKVLANRSNQFNYEPNGVRFDTGLSIASGPGTAVPDSICVTYITE